MILMGARGERLAGFAPDPYPRLLGTVAGDEDDEMLEAGLGQFAVELQAGGVVGQAAVGRFAKPGEETPFFCDCSEGVFGFPGAQRELLARWFPSEFINKELRQGAALQKRSRARKVEGHMSVVANSE